MNINDAFPSNYLKAADLQGREPTVTIDMVKMEKMGDDDKMVVYFSGKEKGMVQNKTNATTIADAYGPETEGWDGRQIKLVTAWVDFQGRSVQALRVRPPDQQNGASQQQNHPAQQSHQAPIQQPPQQDVPFSDEIPF